MFNYLSNDVAAIRQMERLDKARIERLISEVKARQREELAQPSLGARDVGAVGARFSRAAWWVPAGIAVSIVLNGILGG